MKALYLARMVRIDVTFTLNFLAKFVTKWNPLCDRQMCHLFSYLANSCKTRLVSIVDRLDLGQLTVGGYPDADLCGSYDTTRSTSSCFTCLEGPNGTFVQLEWFSKRQSATSHSTTEAEMISLSKILRKSVVPILGLWTYLLERKVTGSVFEDNQSTIQVAESGYSQQLRHLAKHHRISLGLVHDIVSHPDVNLFHIDTNKQKGDLLTKGLSRIKHNAAMDLVGLYRAMCLLICL